MPFMCEFCGRSFPRLREATYHEWRHTGIPEKNVKRLGLDNVESDPGEGKENIDGGGKSACGCGNHGKPQTPT